MDSLDKKYQNEDVVERAAFEIIDEASGSKLRVVVIKDTYGLNIKPLGYGDGLSPVTLDFFSGKNDTDDDPLRVVVWADKENEDPTDIISLAGVKNNEEEGKDG